MPTALAVLSLLSVLKQQFTLTPNYARPLSDRIVGERFDPATGQVRPITEREYVELRYWGVANGHPLRQVWAFTVEGVSLHFNDAFENWNNRGIQYASHCAACGRTIWNNADRAPQPLCRECRSQSGWCPETERTCEGAYKSRIDPCRCETCRAWNAAKHRRLRAARRAGGRNPTVSLQKQGLQGKATPVTPLKTKNGVTRVETMWPDGFAAAWWLPAPVRTLLETFDAAAVEAEQVFAATTEHSLIWANPLRDAA